jgi:uncharacterized membrane protein (UPF0127 family)
MPREIHVINKTRPATSLPRILVCDTFLTQLRGFTFRSRLAPDVGLILVGSRNSRLDSSIHMLFVSFDLTVVWINSDLEVVDKTLAKSWRPAYFSKRPAKYVLEIHPERWGEFSIGDLVEFKDA